MSNFISLHNHTHYSILDAISSPKELFLRAKELGMNSLSITDHGTFAGVWEAWKLSKEIGVKLIIGAEFYFVNDIKNKDAKFRHIILIAKNAEGYKNILTLNKLGYDNASFSGKRVYSVIDWDLLKKYNKGVICLTSCGNGIVSQLLMNKKTAEAEETAIKLLDIFGEDLGLEIQANNMKRNGTFYNDEIDQAFINRQLINMGKKLGIKVVPTCNSHYVKKEDHETHDLLLSIGSHQTIYSNFRLKYPVQDFYLKSYEEIKAFFSRNYGEEYAEELCQNSVYFAEKCEIPEWIDPKYSNPSGKELPIFPVKEELDFDEFCRWNESQTENIKSLDDDKKYLRFKVEKGLKNKFPNEIDKIYLDRVDEEIDVLEFHGFSSYMLIVADFLNWARNNNIRVGQGRGSVGGSLVAYLLGIHNADPIKYNLIFARFHNKEKTSFPDIDSDIAPSGREKVQNYLRQKYGDDHVVHVSNVNTITPKVYVRDVARACELGGSKEAAVKLGNDVADSISADIHSIEEALEKSPIFAEYAKRYPEFIKYKSVCGKYRAWSTHAGGIIISARSLTGLVPLRRDKDGALAIEYDKDKAEENGLVKMDTLGLSTLDIISKAIELIEKSGKELSFPPNYDEYDKKTYDLISSGDTFGVFQLGTSAGTVDLCRRIKAKNIEDISHINALARPSAKDIRDSFIKTKEGKKDIILLHPNLKRAFGFTYGFGLYEESLMYLAQDIAGWSLHSADRLRKLTKEKGKNPKKAQQWRTEFIQDSVANGIEEEIGKRVWDDVISAFGNYGFNLSHSVLYSMNSYDTAYLKAHYPIEFLLANLIAELDSNTPNAESNVEKIKNEIRSHNVKIIPPHINHSNLHYTVIENNQLLTGLDALKFVGEDAIADILEKRPFNSFFEFMVKTDSRKVRSTAIQALAASGALDCFNISRKKIYLYCSDYRKKLQVWLKKHDPNKETFNYPFPEEKDWSIPELYALENHYLGESFICRPHIAYTKFFDQPHLTVKLINKLENKTFVDNFYGIVRDMVELKIKKESSKYYGQTMVKCVVEDKDGDRITVTIFPDKLEKLNKRIKSLYNKQSLDIGLAMQFSAVTNLYEDNLGLIFNDLYNCKPPPSLPLDLKAKKVALKITKEPKQQDKSPENLFSEIEDDLINDGLLDIDAEYDGEQD